MIETDVVKKVVKRAKFRGWRYYKFVSPGQVGVPDNIFTKKPGRIIFIEFKRPGGDPSTSKQRHEQQKLRDQGFEVFEVEYPEEGYEIFDAR